MVTNDVLKTIHRQQPVHDVKQFRQQVTGDLEHSFQLTTNHPIFVYVHIRILVYIVHSLV